MPNQRSVIIVGAGIFGLTTAWFCQKRGFDVTVVEKDTIAAGASGGVMGTMSPNVPETWNIKKQFQLDALLSAADFWQEIETASGLSTGYGRIGRLMPIGSERALHHAKIREIDARTLWNGHAEWQIKDAGLYSDLLSAEYTPFGVIHETLSARISPRLACTALAKALVKSGARIIENWAVSDIAPNRVIGSDGTLTADDIVIAAGAESFPLLRRILGTFKGIGVKGQAAVFSGANFGGAPQIFANGLYIIPHTNGDVAIGSTSEDNWTDATSTDHKLDQLIQKALDTCPLLRGAHVTERWAGLRPRGDKPDPILGPIPGYHGLYVATGGYKIGFGITHSCADLVAKMIDDDVTSMPDAFLIGPKDTI